MTTTRIKPARRKNARVPDHLPRWGSDARRSRRIVEAFGAWVASVGDAMIDAGAPLSISKTITTAGITDGQQAAAIGGYSIIQAIDLDAATKLVRPHPFTARGGTLQVTEVDIGGRPDPTL